MIITCPSNNTQSSGILVFYHRCHTGPNWFSVYYKNVAKACLTVDHVKHAFGKAKFTDTVKSIVSWCTEMIDKYNGDEEKVEGVA